MNQDLLSLAVVENWLHGDGRRCMENGAVHGEWSGACGKRHKGNAVVDSGCPLTTTRRHGQDDDVCVVVAPQAWPAAEEEGYVC